MAGHITSKFSRGQVIPLTALLLGLVTLSTMFLYNSNIVVTERIKLQNTTDAAAYSGAAMDARYLNFMAYSNRAMIADHVMTAQAVGLASTGIMLKEAGENIESIFGKIPYYGKYAKAIKEGLAYQSLGLEKTADVAIPIMNVTTRILSEAQNALRLAYPVASTALIQKIVAANDPKAEFSLTTTAGRVKELDAFLQQYSPDDLNSMDKQDRVNEFYDITKKSRNKFSANRSGDWSGELLEAANKISLVSQFKVDKFGGSDMSNGDRNSPRSMRTYKTWGVMDTVSFYWRRGFNVLGIHKWGDWHEIGLGGGSGTAGDNYNFNRDQRKRLYGNGAWKNKNSATTFMGDKYENTSYSGLLPFVDLKARGRVDSAVAVVVVVNKKEENISTTKTLDIAKGTLDISQKGSYRDNGQYSLAKGRTYFQRPDTTSSLYSTNRSRREFGNLYNPFWLPSLEKSGALESAGAINLARGVGK